MIIMYDFNFCYKMAEDRQIARCYIYYRGGDSYSKVGGLMRGEARQRAIARCDLEGSGGMHPWDCFGFLGL